MSLLPSRTCSRGQPGSPALLALAVAAFAVRGVMARLVRAKRKAKVIFIGLSGGSTVLGSTHKMQAVLIALRIVTLITRVSSQSGQGYWTLVPCLERASAEME